MGDDIQLPSCPRCGHPHLHRSSPRSRGERLALTFTPVRFFRCHACKHRGWTTGPVSKAELEERAARRQLRSRRTAATLRWALAVGVALAATVGLALAT